MRIISRKLALTHLAINEITQCSEKDIDNILFADYFNEEGEHIEYTNIYNDSIQEFLLNYFIDVRLKGYSNKYLQQTKKIFLLSGMKIFWKYALVVVI